MFIGNSVITIIQLTLDIRNYSKLLLWIPLAGIYLHLGTYFISFTIDTCNKKYPAWTR